MEKMTIQKLNDLCDGNVMNHVSMICVGTENPGCVCRGYGCVFARVPTTCIDDMWKHVARMRPYECEVPIDKVMDLLKGY